MLLRRQGQPRDILASAAQPWPPKRSRTKAKGKTNMKLQIAVALIAGLLAIEKTVQAAAPKGNGVQFNRDIRPILAQHCFKCHGIDDSGRKGQLRLDVRDAALKGGKSGMPAIVPGNPDQSEMVRRLFTDERSEKMPPPSTKTLLTVEEKEKIRAWIAAGAEYASHWAFVAPRTPALPEVKDAGWPKNPIDRFILARLEQEGLKTSPPADRYTLIRRVYLDLIGLPPSPDAVDAFVNDRHPKAYEQLVARLLASPHYGERWARRWLDLARYADTNGYEKDRPRSIWLWREWVINALNSDLPFDQFTIKQIAGDLLPKATLDDRIATGFHRNTMLNEEGGIDPLEFRFHAMTDRVATTGTAWLGLTIGCAQCHTHKYDPIHHREYYQLMAFLNNADELEIDLPRADIEMQRQAIQNKIPELIAGLAARFPPAMDHQPPLGSREHLEQKFAAWLEHERGRGVHWTPLHPVEAKSNLPLLTVQEDDSVFASGDITKSDTYQLKFRGDFRGIRAVRLEVLPDERLPASGPGLCYYEGPKGDFFLSEFQLRIKNKPVPIAAATESFARNNFGKNPVSAKLATDGDPQTGWSCAGRFGERHEAVFVLAAPLDDIKELDLTMQFGRHYACSLGRFRISLTTETGAVARDLPEETQRLLLIPDAELKASQREQLLQRFLLVAPELAKIRTDIERQQQALPRFPTTLVFQERPPENPRPTFIHSRGEFLRTTERVVANVPAALSPLPLDAPRNRLTFARWLVAPDNPLTARVTVNQQWQAFFGRGLVRTTADFGIQGDPPSHPELLDWLALEFMSKGWSLKDLHRLIVTSATYQQSSRLTPALLAKDPENKLLARGPRVRLEAEMIRDTVLHASGLLSTKVGGPSVYPPQPASITTEGAYGRLDWKVSQGEDRFRRGLYTFSKRTAPYAMLTTFDGPSGESCLARREVSNTPLQALTLLNDAVFVEAAQALGRRLATLPGSEEERVQLAFRRILTRPATKDEIEKLTAFFVAQKRRFSLGELNAATVAGSGDGDVNERAAWTTLVRVLFNLDETITKG